MRTVLLILGVWTGVAFALVGGWVLVVKIARRRRRTRDAEYASAVTAGPFSLPPQDDGGVAPSVPTGPGTSDEAAEMRPMHAVVRAWTESNADPRRHAEAQSAVRQAIPDLAHALDRLAEESRHRRTS